MKNFGWFGLAAASLLACVAFEHRSQVKAAGGPPEVSNSPFRVLAAIESGSLLLFPVVRASSKSPGETRSSPSTKNQRAGRSKLLKLVRVQGWCAPGEPARNGGRIPDATQNTYRGDQVNTPGSRQQLPEAAPAAGWRNRHRGQAGTASLPRTASFPSAQILSTCLSFASSPVAGLKARPPSVPPPKPQRTGSWFSPLCVKRAMAEKDQQQVWDSVHGAISQMAMAAAPTPSPGSGGAYDTPAASSFGTTSYAKVVSPTP